MILNCILLAFSASIDSLGIGITYGIKNIKITSISNIILFAISFICTIFSMTIGIFFHKILNETFCKFIGSSLLVLIGLYTIYKSNSIKKNNCYDLDNSHYIDKNEAITLGFALSIDSIAIGISSGIFKINMLILPLFIAAFQLLFLNCGNYIGNYINNYINLSNKMWNVFSGLTLIFIGLLKAL